MDPDPTAFVNDFKDAGGNRHVVHSVNQWLDYSVGDPGNFAADPWIRTYL